MFAKDPSWIEAPIGRRDNIGQMEHLVISLDSYHDRRTAYSFAITAGGVRGDYCIASDAEQDMMSSLDPVWDGHAHRDALGWTAEMRIPFNQLRFNAADQQTWRVNFRQWIPSTNEDIFRIPIPSNVTAWESRMGTQSPASSHRAASSSFRMSPGKGAATPIAIHSSPSTTGATCAPALAAT